MKIAIIANKNIAQTDSVISELKNSLESYQLDCDVLNIDNLKSGYDFVCAIGGDGTILKASRFYAKTETPVIGINLGRLGFLSLINPSEINKIGDIIKNKKYSIEKRMMLKSGNCYALNDIVIKGHSAGRTSKFNLYINDKIVSEYIADGIIISTPTGSTAYGLSAGGPILHPALNSIVIVPICAHTMTARPLVVPATERILIKSVDELLDVSCDGQETIEGTLNGVKEVVVKTSEHKALLAFPKNNNFYSILKSKLLWGLSPVSEDLN